MAQNVCRSGGLYTGCMAVRIAIPEPTSSDTEYNQRALPQYVEALKAAGAEPVVVPLSEPQDRVAKLLASVQGVLLPGSSFDVDPQRYGEARKPECAEDDPGRTAADELMLQDAFNLRKPILAICAGTQNLNVWRGGALVQDLKTAVNHQPGREVVKAHPVEIAQGIAIERDCAGVGSGRCGSELQPSPGDSRCGRQSASDCGFAGRWRD